jgi:hypothetical protein
LPGDATGATVTALATITAGLPVFTGQDAIATGSAGATAATATGNSGITGVTANAEHETAVTAVTTIAAIAAVTAITAGLTRQNPREPIAAVDPGPAVSTVAASTNHRQRPHTAAVPTGATGAIDRRGRPAVTASIRIARN